MKYTLFCILILLMAGCSPTDNTPRAIAKNTAAAEKSQICTTCHGIDGKHGKVNVPPLGGRSYEELVAAMQRVKESYSPQPTLVHSLSDEDIRDIASYFSSFK